MANMANMNDMYPVLNMPQMLVVDDQTIMSNSIPRQYLMRQIGLAWFRIMEEIFNDVPVGTRILVRRDMTFQNIVGNHMIHDYITTRVAHPTIYGNGWTHQSVAYLHNEVSPYPFTLDAATERERIMMENNNNHMIQWNVPDASDVQPDRMEEDGMSDAIRLAEEFIQPIPGLSSSSLFTFNR